MYSRFRFGLAWALIAICAAAQTADQLYRKGTELFQARDLSRARTAFLLVLEKAPPGLSSRYFLGRIALLESKPQDAVKWLEPLAHADPPMFDAAAQLGKAYFDLGQMDRAQATVERALRQAPWDGALHYRLGRIYQHMGRGAQAQAEFAASARLKSEDRESVQLLVACSEYIANGQRAEALRVRDELLSNASLDPDVLVALGLAFAESGLTQDSLEPFVSAAKRDPSFYQAHYNAGLTLLKLERPAEALAPLEAGRKLAPGSFEVNSALSLAYVLQQRFSDAIPPLETAHQLQPRNQRVSSTLALAYLRTGAAARAIPILRAIVPESRNDPKPHFLLIEALNATEQQAEALQAAEHAAKLFPDAAQAHLAVAQQHARLGRYGEAGPEFTRALELNPAQIESLLGLAEVQQKQGDYPASLETYRRVLTLQAGSLTATLGAARDLVLLRKLDEARKLLESAQSTHADNAQLHLELSRVYARLGERDLASQQTQIVQELRAREAKRP